MPFLFKKLSIWKYFGCTHHESESVHVHVHEHDHGYVQHHVSIHDYDSDLHDHAADPKHH